MASTFSNLGLELQTTGENANTWGDKTNVNLELIDERLSAIGTITNTSDFSLPAPSNATKSVNNGAATLKFTGSLSGLLTVTMPAKTLLYNIVNATSGGQDIKFKCSTETTVATIKSGQNGVIHSDGSANVFLISTVANDFDDDVTIQTGDGALLTLQTGDLSVTDGDVLGALQFQAPLESDSGSGDADGRKVSASIVAEADASFDANTNSTDLVFKLATDGAVAEKMRLAHEGVLSIPADGSTTTNGIHIGASADLKIYHDGSNSYINDTGTGGLLLLSSFFGIKDASGAEYLAHGEVDGSFYLYHNGNVRVQTTDAGATISGVITATGFTIGSAAITEAELEYLDQVTPGTVAASHAVVVDGNKDITGFRNIANTGTITAGGDITAFSDERLKSDIETIDNALDKVMSMRGVSYTKQAEKGIGVIAQEVEKVLPEVVSDGEYKSVAYGNMVGVLIEAIKELKTEIDTHKQGCKCHDITN